MMSDPSEMIRHDRQLTPDVAGAGASRTTSRAVLVLAVVAAVLVVLVLAL